MWCLYVFVLCYVFRGTPKRHLLRLGTPSNSVPTETSSFYMQRNKKSLFACGLRGIACMFLVSPGGPQLGTM